LTCRAGFSQWPMVPDSRPKVASLHY
jgi:hypothetical protein